MERTMGRPVVGESNAQNANVAGGGLGPVTTTTTFARRPAPLQARLLPLRSRRRRLSLLLRPPTQKHIRNMRRRILRQQRRRPQNRRRPDWPASTLTCRSTTSTRRPTAGRSFASPPRTATNHHGPRRVEQSAAPARRDCRDDRGASGRVDRRLDDSPVPVRLAGPADRFDAGGLRRLAVVGFRRISGGRSCGVGRRVRVEDSRSGVFAAGRGIMSPLYLWERAWVRAWRECCPTG